MGESFSPREKENANPVFDRIDIWKVMNKIARSKFASLSVRDFIFSFIFFFVSVYYNDV